MFRSKKIIIELPSDSFENLLFANDIYTIKLFVDNDILSESEILSIFHDYYEYNVMYVPIKFMIELFEMLDDKYNISSIVQIFFNVVLSNQKWKGQVDVFCPIDFLEKLISRGAVIENDIKTIMLLPDNIFFDYINKNEMIIDNNNCKFKYTISPSMAKWIINNNNFDFDKPNEIAKIIIFGDYGNSLLLEYLIDNIIDTKWINIIIMANLLEYEQCNIYKVLNIIKKKISS